MGESKKEKIEKIIGDGKPKQENNSETQKDDLEKDKKSENTTTRLLLAKECKNIAWWLLLVFWVGVVLCLGYGVFRLGYMHPTPLLEHLYNPLTTAIIVIGVCFLVVIEILALILIFRTKRLEKCYEEEHIGKIWLMYVLGMVTILFSVYASYDVRGHVKWIIEKSTKPKY